MKYSKHLIFLVTFFALANMCLGQDERKAVLVDEFGPITCEEFLGRIDSFFADLQANPQDLGYIVIYSSGRNPLGFKKFATAALYLRQFDSERIRIVSVKDSSEVDGRFWRVPPGGTPPTYIEVVEPNIDFSKPFIFGSHFEENVCPSFVPKLYADFIKLHPGANGKIVVYGNSWRQRRDYAEATLKVFETDFGLSRDRIRIYYVHRPNVFSTEAEYWLVPAKKK